MIQTTLKPYYSVVILTASGGVISRTHGTHYGDAVAHAKQRRADFPDAKEVRVVCESSNGGGVLVSL